MVECWPRVATVLIFLTVSMGLAAQANGGRVPPAKTTSAASSNPFDQFQSFSALLSGGLADDHDRKIYRSGNLLRSDFEASYRITDLKTLSMWGVQPDGCVQFAAPDASSFPFSAYRDFNIDRSLSGEKESLDGHACKIENLTFSRKDSPRVIKMKLWEAEDLKGFPIKIEVDNNGRAMAPLHYSNVSFAPPDPKLFHHPAKCTTGPQSGQKGTVKIAPQAPKQESNTSPQP
ncbi:MAG: hypothetical protein ABSD75_11100 [Terriglobales bacterium]